MSSILPKLIPEKLQWNTACIYLIHLILHQPALQGTVPDRNPSCRLQPDMLDQLTVPAEDKGGRACTALLQDISECPVKACQLGLLAHSLPVRGIEDYHRRCCGRFKGADVRRSERRDPGHFGADGVLPCHVDSPGGAVVASQSDTQLALPQIFSLGDHLSP